MALDVPLSRIYEASKPQPMSRWELPTRLDRLPTTHQRIVEAFAGALLDAYEQGLKDGQATRRRVGRRATRRLLLRIVRSGTMTP